MVTNLFGMTASTKAVLTVEEVPPRPAYVRSTSGQPWGNDSNEQLMDQVFGQGNWDDYRYETINLGLLFAPTRRFIFMEGSDSLADELEAFLNANRIVIQNWVQTGGVLFLNSAPNEGDGMDFGFGVTLVDDDFSNERRRRQCRISI